MSKSVDGVTTNYLVDKNRDYAQVLEERDGGAGLIASYVYGDDLISMDRSGAVSFYHYDGNGNTRQLTDALENITDIYIYDAFGITLDRTGTTENDYLYTGEQYDFNIGFYYLRARYYNASIGRFNTMDKDFGLIYDPKSLHKYTYAFNEPVNYVDPSGNFSIYYPQFLIFSAMLLTLYAFTLTPAFRAFSTAMATLILSFLNQVNTYLASFTEPMLASHYKDVIDGLLANALAHADKVASLPPGGPWGPQNHWKKEIKAALERAKKLAEKYLKGKTKAETLEKIRQIAEKAKITLP